ncbi:hypothetical protein JNUCC0626_48530 [Lentzea sp. JNUCC 0626]|uniref:hypothetical protein n=1 Tax=Lentzea sp. JNUCC 0626 TaxID=3367513 RepID=UPI00374934FF
MDSVLVTDDPQREYLTKGGPVPGDLITVTEHLTGCAWRFIPDNTTPGIAWLLLGPCPSCRAEIPVARLAGLADLGDHLDRGTEPFELIAEACNDFLHSPGCASVRSAIAELVATPLPAGQPVAGGDHRAAT